MANVNAADGASEAISKISANDSIKKYLTFLSDQLVFGIDTFYVTEIIINHNITFLPMVPDYIKGIINLRGQMIPIIDIRLRMGKEELFKEDGSNCIIVLNINSILIGVLVDTVRQVLDVDTSLISPPTVNNHEPLVNGIATLTNGTTMLSLDCEALIET